MHFFLLCLPQDYYKFTVFQSSITNKSNFHFISVFDLIFSWPTGFTPQTASHTSIAQRTWRFTFVITGTSPSPTSESSLKICGTAFISYGPKFLIQCHKTPQKQQKLWTVIPFCITRLVSSVPPSVFRWRQIRRANKSIPWSVHFLHAVHNIELVLTSFLQLPTVAYLSLLFITCSQHRIPWFSQHLLPKPYGTSIYFKALEFNWFSHHCEV